MIVNLTKSPGYESSCVLIELMARQIIKILLLGAVFFTSVNSGVFVDASKNDLFISEVGFMGSSTGGGHDKWVEIFNPTLDTVDLNKYKLISGTQGLPVDLFGTLNSGSSLIVSTTRNGTDTIFNYTGNVTQQASWNPMSFLSRNSGTKHITISLTKNGNAISNINYGNGFINSIVSNYGESKGSIECNEFGNCWAASSIFYPGNYGTPGYVSYVTVVQPAQIEPAPVIAETPAPSPIQTSPTIQSPVLSPIAETVKQLEPAISSDPTPKLSKNPEVVAGLPILNNQPQLAPTEILTLETTTDLKPVAQLESVAVEKYSEPITATTPIKAVNNAVNVSVTLTATPAVSTYSNEKSQLTNIQKPFVELQVAAKSEIYAIQELNLSPLDYSDFIILLVTCIYIEFSKQNKEVLNLIKYNFFEQS